MGFFTKGKHGCNESNNWGLWYDIENGTKIKTYIH